MENKDKEIPKTETELNFQIVVRICKNNYDYNKIQTGKFPLTEENLRSIMNELFQIGMFYRNYEILTKQETEK